MSIPFLGKPHLKTQQTAKRGSTLQPREQLHYKDNSNGNFSEGPVAKMFIMKDALICCAPTAPPWPKVYVRTKTATTFTSCFPLIWSQSLLMCIKLMGMKKRPKNPHSGTHEPVLLQVGCTVFLPPEIISKSLCSHSGSYCLSAWHSNSTKEQQQQQM